MLCILAHQDDEAFFSTCIAREARRGNAVRCAFLTDGRARGADPARRDAESRRVLAALGLGADAVRFLGTELGIEDGELPRHLQTALDAVARTLDGRDPDRIYAPAWEGGHQDHDAAHLVALALARQRRRVARTWQIPLYNGHRTPWTLFRVLHALPGPRHRCAGRLGWREGWRQVWLPARYPSQWRSWIGLWPAWALERGLRRREILLGADPRAVRERPHAGPLLYERRTAWSYEAFREATAEFVDRHLPRTGAATPL